MKILLISPPFYRILGFYNRYFPLGITIIGTVLKKMGHEVKVYDADCYVNPVSIDYSQLPAKYPEYLDSLKNEKHPVWKEVEKTIIKYKPDLVGISAFTPFVASAFRTAKISKKIFPNIKIILGGPHATVKAEETLKICTDIDYAVSGEGEKTIEEFVNWFFDKKGNINNINGLVYRRKNNILKNAPRIFSRDFNKYPTPDRSLLTNEKKYSSEDMGLIMTSRGCPYNCTYCASTKGLGYRCVDGVIKEIVEVKNKYGTTQFTFKDDSFTVDKNRVIELCQKIIKKKLNIKWECNTRVNLIDEELLATMKQAGCNFIKVGIESGSEKILKSMNKGITLDQSRQAAKMLNRSGIHWTGYFMMGVNGETVNDIYKTLKFMKEIKPKLALIGVYEPFPGTAMFREGIKRGLVKEDMTLSEYLTTPPNDYYKVDPKIQSDIISPNRFNNLQEEIKDEFHRYNMNLGNVWAMGFSKIAVYFKEPKILLEDFDKFIKYVR